MPFSKQTLDEALKIAGIKHARDRETETDGRRTWTAADGTVIGRYDAVEGWAIMTRALAICGTDR